RPCCAAAPRSEFDARTVPPIASWSGPRKCLTRLAPALACVPSWAASPGIQQSLALCVDVEESQHAATLGLRDRMITTDELVVAHATIGQGHSSPRPDSNLRAQGETRSKYQRVE